MAANAGGKIDAGTVLAMASLTMTIILAVLQFAGASSDEIQHLKERVCVVEIAVNKGQCVR